MASLPRNFFFAVVMFALVITSIIAIINLVITGSGNRDQEIPTFMGNEDMVGFNRTFGGSDITNKMETLQDKIAAVQPEEESINIFTLSGAFISSAWASIDFVFSSLNIMDGAIEGLSSKLGVPVWVTGFITTLIIIFFVFSILTLIFGKDT